MGSRLGLLSILPLFILGLAHPARGASFDLYILYDLDGVSDSTSAITPPWIIRNTSTEPLLFGGTNAILSATMDFGTMPLLAPEFIFLPYPLIGRTLLPGQSIGSHHGINLTPPLPEPTYDLDFHPLFEFAGNYIPGAGSGKLEFHIGDHRVTVPIEVSVIPGGDGIADFYGTTKVSSVPEPLGGSVLISALIISFWITRARRPPSPA